jgi:hypothetical protein
MKVEEEQNPHTQFLENCEQAAALDVVLLVGLGQTQELVEGLLEHLQVDFVLMDNKPRHANVSEPTFLGGLLRS